VCQPTDLAGEGSVSVEGFKVVEKGDAAAEPGEVPVEWRRSGE